MSMIDLIPSFDNKLKMTARYSFTPVESGNVNLKEENKLRMKANYSFTPVDSANIDVGNVIPKNAGILSMSPSLRVSSLEKVV